MGALRGAILWRCVLWHDSGESCPHLLPHTSTCHYWCNYDDDNSVDGDGDNSDDDDVDNMDANDGDNSDGGDDDYGDDDGNDVGNDDDAKVVMPENPLQQLFYFPATIWRSEDW